MKLSPGRILAAIFFTAAGTLHFFQPDFYVRIMPPYLPWHLELVYLSGAAEILGGAGLLCKRSRRISAWGLIALLAAVFPANLHLALHPEIFPEVPASVFWLRLPFQALLMVWIGLYTRTAAKPAGSSRPDPRIVRQS
ncbi:MAG: DoxX family membrane protein [Candidatus Omnitrophica bacterium]|nr:DoxX family membrane protein [Candidatus Omnitrophota bacterium]